MLSLHQKFAAVAGLGVWIATGAVATAFPGSALAHQARVSIVHARALAKQLVPGTILSEELEKEAGGSGLRYTFDVRGAYGVREVGIDARTGKVLENSAESASNAPQTGGDPEGAGD